MIQSPPRIPIYERTPEFPPMSIRGFGGHQIFINHYREKIKDGVRFVNPSVYEPVVLLKVQRMRWGKKQNDEGDHVVTYIVLYGCEIQVAILAAGWKDKSGC